MGEDELKAIEERRVVSENFASDNWAQCPHNRPYERCEACGGEDVFALLQEVRRLKAEIEARP